MGWTDEDRLLLFCLRIGTGQKIHEKFRSHEIKKIRWNTFLSRARENGVSAIVSGTLNRFERYLSEFPSFVSEELKKDYYLNAAKNILTFEELGKILGALREGGISVMVLKGAALASTVYKNLALRPMADVDLLLKKEDLLRADARLKLLGYGPADRPAESTDSCLSYLTSLDYRKHSPNSPSFHVHWHFVNSTVPNDSYIHDINIENIWRDAEEAGIAGVKTLAMAPHHLIIHLSEHALRVSHSATKLSYFYDIYEAINSYGSRLDWNKFVDESLEFRLDRMVYFSLYFTSHFLDARIPEYVLLRLKPKRLSLGERTFMKSVLNNRRFSGLSYFVHLAMNNGLAGKTEFVWRTFFPPREVLAQRNYCDPGKIRYIHYIRRINEVLFSSLRILHNAFSRGSCVSGIYRIENNMNELDKSQ